jgi:hypothetical protein
VNLVYLRSFIVELAQIGAEIKHRFINNVIILCILFWKCLKQNLIQVTQFVCQDKSGNVAALPFILTHAIQNQNH